MKDFYLVAKQTVKRPLKYKTYLETIHSDKQGPFANQDSSSHLHVVELMCELASELKEIKMLHSLLNVLFPKCVFYVGGLFTV